MSELAKRLDDLGAVLRKLSGIQVAPEAYLTTEEVAARLQVTEDFVRAMTKVGLPHFHVGKGFRFLWSDVQGFMDSWRRTG